MSVTLVSLLLEEHARATWDLSEDLTALAAVDLAESQLRDGSVVLPEGYRFARLLCPVSIWRNEDRQCWTVQATFKTRRALL